MKLINCPCCGKEVSDKAATCPSCGHKINRMADPEAQKGAIMVIMFIALWILWKIIM